MSADTSCARHRCSSGISSISLLALCIMMGYRSNVEPQEKLDSTECERKFSPFLILNFLRCLRISCFGKSGPS